MITPYKMCIDITMVGQIQAHWHTAEIPGSALSLCGQYMNCAASVGTNNCVQAIRGGGGIQELQTCSWFYLCYSKN